MLELQVNQFTLTQKWKLVCLTVCKGLDECCLVMWLQRYTSVMTSRVISAYISAELQI